MLSLRQYGDFEIHLPYIYLYMKYYYHIVYGSKERYLSCEPTRCYEVDENWEEIGGRSEPLKFKNMMFL